MQEPEKPGRRVRVLTAKELVTLLLEKPFADGWGYGKDRIMFKLKDGQQVSVFLTHDNRLAIELLEVENANKSKCKR